MITFSFAVIVSTTRILELHNQYVAIENPGYAEVRKVLLDEHCRLLPISLEVDGISIMNYRKVKQKRSM